MAQGADGIEIAADFAGLGSRPPPRAWRRPAAPAAGRAFSAAPAPRAAPSAGPGPAAWRAAGSDARFRSRRPSAVGIDSGASGAVAMSSSATSRTATISAPGKRSSTARTIGSCITLSMRAALAALFLLGEGRRAAFAGDRHGPAHAGPVLQFLLQIAGQACAARAGWDGIRCRPASSRTRCMSFSICTFSTGAPLACGQRGDIFQACAAPARSARRRRRRRALGAAIGAATRPMRARAAAPRTAQRGPRGARRGAPSSRSRTSLSVGGRSAA